MRSVIANKVIIFVKYANVDRYAMFAISGNAALRERAQTHRGSTRELKLPGRDSRCKRADNMRHCNSQL